MTTTRRNVQHARQLFNERITRAESEYHDAMRRAVTAECETAEDRPADRSTDGVPVHGEPVAVTEDATI